MKNLLWSLVVLVTLPGFTLAQERSYTIDKRYYREYVDMFEDTVAFPLEIHNTGSAAITLAWRAIYLNVDPHWYTGINDGTQEHHVLGTQHALPIPSQDVARLAFRVHPMQTRGYAWLRIAVWDQAKPHLRDTLSWLLTPYELIGVQQEHSPTTGLTMFPNPASSTIHVADRDVSHVRIYDMRGVLCVETAMEFIRDRTINIGGLPPGMYSVAAASQEGVKITKLVVHR